VKILDFGLAKSRRATTETRVGTTVGTIQYESPEQGRGEIVDQRSDLFSVGVLLYEMLAGQLPFKGEFDDAIRYAIANEEPEPLARYKAGVPDELQRIVTKLLEKDPELRYQTASGVLPDLKLLQRSSGPRPSGIRSSVSSVAPAAASSTAQPTTPSSAAPPPALPRKRRLLPIVVPSAVAVLAVVAALVFKPWKVEISPTQEASAGVHRIAVMYFENLGDREDARRLGEIVANLLISDLSGSKYVQVVSSQRLYDLLKQAGREGQRTIAPDMATQIAQKAGAKWMITGSIMQSEPNFVLSAQLVEVVGGNVLASPTIEGQAGESVYRVVDRLTAGLRGSLSLPAEAQAGRGTSPQEPAGGSTDAYRLYLEGRELGNSYRWIEAESKFAEALKHDSTFAMAYLGVAQARATWWGDVTGERKAIELAKKYADRADERDRFMILAMDARLNQRPAEAVGQLGALLARYPDDKEAYHLLGNLYYNSNVLRDYPRAIEMFRRVVEIDPQYKDAYNTMAYAYDAMGDLEKSLWAINKYIELAPDEPNPYDSRGDLYARNGQPDLALASFQKAIEVSPEFSFSRYKVVGLLNLRGEYDAATKALEYALKGQNPETRSQARGVQIEAALRRGRFREAISQLNLAMQLHEKEVGVDQRLSNLEIWKAYVLGQLQRDYDGAMRSIRKASTLREQLDTSAQSRLSTWGDQAWIEAYFGHAQRADSLLRQLKAQIGTPAMPDSNSYYWIAAEVSLNLGRYDSVATWFERALGSDLPGFYVRVMIGRGHMGARRLRDAVATFESARDVYDGSRWGNGHLDVLLHYWLAQAYEKSGRPADAVKQYQEFLRIWRDADSGIPEVDDAKARLAALGA
jgi:tetratricopeptide (TPR) repeat protein